jgi:hypothetical protein
VGAGGTGGPPGSALGGAAGAFAQFQSTPGYQFPLQQANLATNRALASSGLTGSPGAIGRDIGQLNAGYASQGFNQYTSGLTGLASSGQNAASSLGSIGLGTGAQIGAANTNYGNAAAQGIMNSASATNQGIGQTGGSIGSALNNPSVQNGLSNLFGMGQSSYASQIANPNTNYNAATSSFIGANSSATSPLAASDATFSFGT